MTDTDQVVRLTTDSSSAGSLLRQARVGKGMHIATLAAAIKVSQRKLELLEADQWDQLPDLAFARALAQTVCRTLKLDPAAVMPLLPTVQIQRLEQLGGGLNTPFRERAGQADPPASLSLKHPAVWGTSLFLLAAVAVYAVPADWVRMPWWGGGQDTRQPVQDATPGGQVPSLLTETVPPAAVLGAPVPDLVESLPLSPLGTANAVPDPNSPLELRVTAASWVEVQDGRGRSVFARMVQPNEPVFLGGTLPLRVKIGNASATEVRFRGQRIDLATSTRDNVARIELN